MKQLVAFVSGKIQKVGYRARITQIANTLQIRGFIENLPDGRVKILAEGNEDDLKYFERLIDIKNTLIMVESIEKEYRAASGDFTGFYKLVEPGETESRLDEGIDILKGILSSIEKMDSNLGNKMDKMLDKQDIMIEMQEKTLDRQEETVVEIRGMRSDLHDHMDRRFARIEDEIGEIKRAIKEMGGSCS
jgi:acylphosphatase